MKLSLENERKKILQEKQQWEYKTYLFTVYPPLLFRKIILPAFAPIIVPILGYPLGFLFYIIRKSERFIRRISTKF